jgi:DNA helicase-2/ATP-dependent DNA helicase PcrA
MTYYADLHIHSKWSLATSNQACLEQMALFAYKKGVSLLGTGDCTHPLWLQELEEKLIPDEGGLFRLRPDIESSIFRESKIPPLIRFILQGELSTIYKKHDHTRKIHHLIYLPDFSSAHALRDALSPYGALASDGRPTLLLDARDLLEMVLEASSEAFLIPAHIWTPWFSILGTKTHFDSIEECYEDLTSHIFAVETGLSTDPPMNWRVSSLDRFQLVSNSDAHSPTKIARKDSIFSCTPCFQEIKRGLKTGEGFEGTIEMYPQEGKYFLDGHRKCAFSCLPKETRRLKGLCPHCHKKLTLGVVHRLEELADRSLGTQRPFAKPFFYAIPLSELLSEVLKVGVETKKCHNAYKHLTTTLGSELNILLHLPLSDIRAAHIPNLDTAIDRMRQGKVSTEPGYDGKYGIILTNANKILYQQQ